MKPVIATTDFTDVSLNAVDYAADMAVVLGADLVLFNVCPLPVMLSELPAYGVEQMVQDALDRLTVIRETLRTRTHDRIGITIEVRQGYVVPQLKNYCDESDPYAVVFGTETEHGISRFVMGATTFSAMSQLECPVIVVPAGVHFKGIRKIGLACDFRNVTDIIPVTPIKNLVKEFHAELHVMHVDPEPGAFPLSGVPEAKDVNEIFSELHPVFHFMDGVDVEASISGFADKHDFDLLFVFPRKHTILSKIFQHSHSRKLVLQTHIPVMSIHE